MDILEQLEKDHREVQAILDTLAEGDETGGKRGDLFTELKTKLTAHSRAEEKAVYDPLIETNGRPAREGYVAHDLADYLMTKLARTRNKSTKEWTAGIRNLRDIVTHHVEEEEGKIFAEIREQFDDGKRIEMCEKFNEVKKKFL